jgi:hypothetical protein
MADEVEDECMRACMWRHGWECRDSRDYVDPARDRDHFESRVFEFWSHAPPSLPQVAPNIAAALAWCRCGAFAMSRMADPLAKFLRSLP